MTLLLSVLIEPSSFYDISLTLMQEYSISEEYLILHRIRWTEIYVIIIFSKVIDKILDYRITCRVLSNLNSSWK